MTKLCTDCSTVKKKKEFYAMKSSNDGLHYYCIPCCKLRRAIENVGKREKRVNIGYRQRQRAKELGIECDDTITLKLLYKRDKGVCAICRTLVKPREASIDHTRPFAKGGVHIWENIQLTHYKCNLRKSDKY